MIETVTMYRVKCDGCGKSAQDDSEYFAWAEEDQAWFEANESEWKLIDGKHFCPECWMWDEDTDEAVPFDQSGGRSSTDRARCEVAASAQPSPLRSEVAGSSPVGHPTIQQVPASAEPGSGCGTPEALLGQVPSSGSFDSTPPPPERAPDPERHRHFWQAETSWRRTND